MSWRSDVLLAFLCRSSFASLILSPPLYAGERALLSGLLSEQYRYRGTFLKKIPRHRLVRLCVCVCLSINLSICLFPALYSYAY